MMVFGGSKSTFKKKFKRKDRYGFLKRRAKTKYRNKWKREHLEFAKRRRLIEHKKLQQKAHKTEKKKDIIFTFRKANYPVRASFTSIATYPIYNRNMVITERFRDEMVSVFNGMLFFNYKVSAGAVGSKFGELAPTKQWKAGMTHVKRKKSKKVPKTQQKGAIKGKAAKAAPKKKAKK